MIYFIHAPARVKIGHTANLGQRMSALQTGSPETLRLLAICLGGKDVEAAYHKRFATSRLQGEWFRITPALLDHVATFGPAVDRKLLSSLRPKPPQRTAGMMAEVAEDDDGPAYVD